MSWVNPFRLGASKTLYVTYCLNELAELSTKGRGPVGSHYSYGEVLTMAAV